MKIKQRQEIIRDLVIIILSLIFFILFWRNNLLAFFTLLAIYIVRSRFWYKSGDHTVYIVGALLGTVTEAIAVNSGIWQYTNPTLFKIPLWLPAVWGLASVLIIRIAQCFIKED
ncbi:hypothetical protein ACFL18_00610 [Patescibacteria group bacterium]